jgi:hypothetical protein
MTDSESDFFEIENDLAWSEYFAWVDTDEVQTESKNALAFELMQEFPLVVGTNCQLVGLDASSVFIQQRNLSVLPGKFQVTSNPINHMNFRPVQSLGVAISASQTHLRWIGSDLGDISDLIERQAEIDIFKSLFDGEFRRVFLKLEFDLTGYYFYTLNASDLAQKCNNFEEKWDSKTIISDLSLEFRNMVWGAGAVLMEQLKEFKRLDAPQVGRIQALLAAA